MAQAAFLNIIFFRYDQFFHKIFSLLRSLTKKQIIQIPQVSELTSVEPIPLSTFPNYEKALFGKTFTTAPNNSFLKRPRLLAYFANKDSIADALVQESEAFLLIESSLHPNIVTRMGCLVLQDRVMGLILPKYEYSLLEAVEKKRRIDFSRSIQDLRCALEHLHDLGLAHNGVHLGNLMVTTEGTTVLIDLEFCKRVRVEIAGISRKSSVEHDKIRMAHIQRALIAHERAVLAHEKMNKK